MSSFLKKKTSFTVYTIKEGSEPENIQELIDRIHQTQIHDIKDKKITDAVFYATFSDTDSNQVEIHDDMLGFCYRFDQKKIPENRIKAGIKKQVDEHIKQFSEEPDSDMLYEIRQGVVAELSVGVFPVENTCGVIIDIQQKKVYIEKKGSMSDYVMASLYSSHKISLNPWLSAFKEPKEFEQFLNWLFLSLQSFRDSAEKRDEGASGIFVDMNNAIKMSDLDSSVAIKGDILKFKDMYTNILKGAKVDECDLHLIDGVIKYNYLLSLKNEGMFKNFSSTKFPISFKKDTPESEIILYRGNGIRDLVNHFSKFIKLYQKEIAKFQMEK